MLMRKCYGQLANSTQKRERSTDKANSKIIQFKLVSFFFIAIGKSFCQKIYLHGSLFYN